MHENDDDRSTPVNTTHASVTHSTAADQLASPTALRTIEMLGMLEHLSDGRVLEVLPPSGDLAAELRSLGFAGDLSMLAVASTEDAEPSKLLTSAFDRVLHTEHVVLPEPAAAEEASEATPAPGVFHAVILREPTRLLASHEATTAQVAELLRALGALVALRGMLIVSDMPISCEVEAALLPSGFVLVADGHASSAGDASPMVLQKRTIQEATTTRVLRWVTIDEIKADADLAHSLFDAYRDAWGSDLWGEWLRCSNPDCGRQFSKQAAATLEAEFCPCGRNAPLVTFHDDRMIWRELRDELSDEEGSVCVIRHNAGAVDAFMWGYVADAGQLARKLIPDHALGRSRLMGRVRTLFSEMESQNASGRLYYQSKIAVAETERSPILMIALGARVFQYALDRGCDVVITRTSTQAPAYHLLKGLGLRVIYRYGAPDGNLIDATSQRRGDSPEGTEQRVLLGGSLRGLVASSYQKDYRRMIVQIAHELRGLPAASTRGSRTAR